MANKRKNQSKDTAAPKATRAKKGQDAASAAHQASQTQASDTANLQQAPSTNPVMETRQRRATRGTGGHAAQLEKALKVQPPRVSAQKKAQDVPQDVPQNVLAPVEAMKKSRRRKIPAGTAADNSIASQPIPTFPASSLDPAVLSHLSGAHSAQAFPQPVPEFRSINELGTRYGYHPASMQPMHVLQAAATSQSPSLIGPGNAGTVASSHFGFGGPQSHPQPQSFNIPQSFMRPAGSQAGTVGHQTEAAAALPVDSMGHGLGHHRVKTLFMPSSGPAGSFASVQAASARKDFADNNKDGDDAEDGDGDEDDEEDEVDHDQEGQGDDPEYEEDDEDEDGNEETLPVAHQAAAQDATTGAARREDFSEDHWRDPSDDEGNLRSLTQAPGVGPQLSVPEANVNRDAPSGSQMNAIAGSAPSAFSALERQQGADVLSQYHAHNRPVNPPSRAKLAQSRSFQNSAGLISEDNFAGARQSSLSPFEEPNASPPGPASDASDDEEAVSEAEEDVVAAVEPSQTSATDRKEQTFRFYCSDSGWRSVTLNAKHLYKRYTVLKNAFPTRSTDLDEATLILATARDAFLESGGQLSSAFSINRNMSIMVYQDHSNYRNAMKKVAHGIVREAYKYTVKYVADPDMAALVNNEANEYALIRQQVNDMLEGGRFHWGPDDETGMVEMMAHPAIEDLILRFYYEGKECMAALYPEDFDCTVPNHAVALATVCIQNCLEEYLTGRFARKEFSCENYYHTFNNQLQFLEVLDNDATSGLAFRTRKRDWARKGSAGLSKAKQVPVQFPFAFPPGHPSASKGKQASGLSRTRAAGGSGAVPGGAGAVASGSGTTSG